MLKMRPRSVYLALAVVVVVGGTPLFNDEGREPANHHTRRIPSSYVRHEWHDEHLLDGWERSERARGNASLPMRIGLVQSQETIQAGHDMLMDMSVQVISYEGFY